MKNTAKVINFRWERLKHNVNKALKSIWQYMINILRNGRKIINHIKHEKVYNRRKGAKKN